MYTLIITKQQFYYLSISRRLVTVSTKKRTGKTYCIAGIAHKETHQLLLPVSN